ncbi:M12 family metallopeptidase [Pseudomonas typographi]|uniref:M12 family metallopeptidase n=1 Tax=Pseudomonas typographi TaxID=2715964 RepID=UPI0016841D69|nr:M12 family metallopeptidase [Pseudomonas typographi]MBD1587854.1 matrixin family metalloprotease [Pseudomonas typographi]
MPLLCQPPRTIDPDLAYAAAVEERTDNAPASRGGRHKRSVGVHTKFWATGRTLTVAWVDDPLDTEHWQAIQRAILQWQPHINLDLQFIDGREGQPGEGRGDVRITTDSNRNYSLIGTDAKHNDPWAPTMVLGVKPQASDFEATVMHEFGHALGLEHEHQHPEANIPWDLAKLYRHYAKAGHSEQDVNEQVLAKLPKADTRYTAYDPESIIHYPVPNDLTLGDWEVGRNTRLSDRDKALIASIYPRS